MKRPDPTELEGHTPDELRSMYEDMVLVRRFEERIDELFAEGLLSGTCHLGIGQEAVAVGTVRGLKSDDWVSSTHRGHGHFLAKGADEKRVMAEMFGKAPGYSGGRGGSQHMACFEIGFLGSNGITGGGIPVGTGAALALARRKSDQVVAVFMGDGAANQGVFHETLNMAVLWKLPVIYVCENNRYAMSMPYERAFATATIAERVAAFGIPAETADGNDVLLVAETVRNAAERARSGQGPSFIEFNTYRFCGHSKSDRRVYRSRDEEATQRERCPIRLFGRKLTEGGVLDDVSIREIRARVQKRIAEAETFAREAPEPDPSQGVFAEP